MSEFSDPIAGESNKDLTTRADIANKRFLRTRSQLAIVLLLFATAALLVAGFALRSLTQEENLRLADAHTTSKKIDELTKNLVDAQAKLLTEQQSVASVAVAAATGVADQLNKVHDKDVCVALYDAATQATFQDEFTTLVKVVVAGFSTAPAPSPDRAAALNAALLQLTDSLDKYVTAIQDKKDYIAGGSVLPCPLNADSIKINPPSTVTTIPPGVPSS